MISIFLKYVKTCFYSSLHGLDGFTDKLIKHSRKKCNNLKQAFSKISKKVDFSSYFEASLDIKTQKDEKYSSFSLMNLETKA